MGDSHAKPGPARIDSSLVPPRVVTVATGLRKAGYAAYVVGGCVRDIVMHRMPADYDIATSALPGEVSAVFDHAVPTGERFGTVTVVVTEPPQPDPCTTVEVTTFRSDGIYADGRHPSTIAFGASLVDDLARRDFTMNAMACDPETGEVTDPFGGRSDIEARLVRAVGDPYLRFAEDKLRMLRAVRFAAVLDFGLDGATHDAIAELASQIRVVSVERITAELDKLLLAPVPSKGIELMRETGLLAVIMPELLLGYGMHQNRYHSHTVYYHTLACLDAIGPELHLRWAALLHDIGKPEAKRGEHFYGHEESGAVLAEAILTRMRKPTRFARRVTHLVRHHMVGFRSQWSGAAVRRLIARVGAGNMPDLMSLHAADMLAKGPRSAEDLAKSVELTRRVREELAERPHGGEPALAVSGDDIAALVGGPGPMVGKVLRQIRARVVDDPELNDRDALLRIARRLAKVP